MVSVWPQWWQPVGGPRDKIWDLVALVWPIRSRWLQPLQLWLGAGISLVAQVLVSQDRDLCHVQLHPTWFESTSECRSWPVVSYLYSGHLLVGLYLGWGSLLLVGPLFHFHQCHSGLVPSRNEHMCPCHSVTRAGSWYGRSKGSRCLYPQLPANRTLSQSRPPHRDELGPCVGNNYVTPWTLGLIALPTESPGGGFDYDRINVFFLWYDFTSSWYACARDVLLIVAWLA